MRPMDIFTAYALFLLYPLLSRGLIFFRKREAMGLWIPGWLIGISQDLAVAAACTGLYALGTPFFLLALLPAYHLLDAFLLLAADFRMKFSFFRYLFEFRDFQSSAVDMGIRPLSILLGAAYLALCLLFWLLSPESSFPMTLFLVTFALGLCSLYYKGKTYLWDNILFQEGLNLVQPLVQRKVERKRLSVIPAQCEKSRSLSPHYPLLKMTEGFTGDKLFSVRVEKEEKPHVILVALESFGAKYLGSLGYPHKATPNMDRMAEKGIVFSNFHAAGIPTSRSLLATLFGIHPDLDTISLQERNPLFPLIGIQDVLKGNGYRTVYHKGGSLYFLNAVKYLKNHGFDELAGDEQVIEALAHGSRTSWGVHDKELFQYSFERLQKLDSDGTPTFMMVCTISNHHPWQVPEGYQAPEFNVDSPLLARYLQTAYYTDDALGHFVRQLEDSGLSKRSIVIVTADNAQPMGEHGGNYMPLKEVYEENHRIPLLIYADGRINTPGVIDDLGSQVDLMPTIMDMLSLKGLNHSIGTSLMRKAPERHAFCVNTHILPYLSHNEGDFKYCLRLDTEQKQLFHLRDDPGETKNVLTRFPEVGKRLHDQLMQHFTSLQTLYAEKRITPESDKSIVLLGDWEVTDETLTEEAKKHKSLNSILISECSQITDEGFVKLLKKAENLEFLYLNKLHLTEKSLTALEGKTANLKELTLSHIQSIPAKAMIRLLKECPLLEELTLSGNIQVQDDVIETIAKSCRSLQNLELPECFGLTSEGVELIAGGCPNLNRLNLQGLTCVTDKTLEKLSKGVYDLHAFHILNCPDVSGKGVWSVCENNPSLRRLSFSGEMVDNETITRIANHCPEMMKLLVHGCAQFTEEGFASIAKKFQKLVILELADCPQMTDAFFESLADKPIDHLLVAGAPQITDDALSHIEKISTLRTLIFYFCPGISEDVLMETGARMNKTGILHEITFNRTKKVFYSLYRS